MSDVVDIYERNVSALGRTVERGLRRPPVQLPEYRTITPAILPSTPAVGALDGADQQLFGVAANSDLGIGVWATLYVEYDVHQPTTECFRDGPSSAGSWSEDELLSYHLTGALPDQMTTRELQNNF